MANTQKFRAHESLNTDTAATWELQTATTDAPVSGAGARSRWGRLRGCPESLGGGGLRLRRLSRQRTFRLEGALARR